MLTPGIGPCFIAQNTLARRRTLRSLPHVRHDFAQYLGAPHRFGSFWRPSFPRMTVEGVPYRRFSHGWGWEPFSGFAAPANWIAADILRIQDGILIEHWDVIQDEVARDQ